MGFGFGSSKLLKRIIILKSLIGEDFLMQLRFSFSVINRHSPINIYHVFKKCITRPINNCHVKIS